MKIVNLNTISETGVSHDPSIKKKVIFDNTLAPTLTTFAQATFQPGQSVKEHCHETMFEIFFIQSGKALFIINGKEFEAHDNDCICIEPKEMHVQANPFDKPVTWLYFGIATD